MKRLWLTRSRSLVLHLTQHAGRREQRIGRPENNPVTTPPPFTFPQTHRLKTPAEFDRCYKRKRSAADNVLVVYACENGLPHPRLGCSVSRKVGNAVVRNRYKRLFREAFRLAQHDLPVGTDFILIPRHGPEPSLHAVSESLRRLARQAARRLDSPRPPPANRGETTSSGSPS